MAKKKLKVEYDGPPLTPEKQAVFDELAELLSSNFKDGEDLEAALEVGEFTLLGPDGGVEVEVTDCRRLTEEESEEAERKRRPQ